MEKISVIDMDCFVIPQPKYTPEYASWDLETSFCTKKHFKNFRSLFAYNRMESGFTTLFLSKSLEKNMLFLQE